MYFASFSKKADKDLAFFYWLCNTLFYWYSKSYSSLSFINSYYFHDFLHINKSVISTFISYCFPIVTFLWDRFPAVKCWVKDISIFSFNRCCQIAFQNVLKQCEFPNAMDKNSLFSHTPARSQSVLSLINFYQSDNYKWYLVVPLICNFLDCEGGGEYFHWILLNFLFGLFVLFGFTLLWSVYSYSFSIFNLSFTYLLSV